LHPDFTPKHAKRYGELGRQIIEATQQYIAEVQQGSFPTDQESYQMDEATLSELLQRTP
jgi:3-methyl-2-oxobutanoate hydroxymethyltransferase